MEVRQRRHVSSTLGGFLLGEGDWIDACPKSLSLSISKGCSPGEGLLLFEQTGPVLV